MERERERKKNQIHWMWNEKHREHYIFIAYQYCEMWNGKSFKRIANLKCASIQFDARKEILCHWFRIGQNIEYFMRIEHVLVCRL